MKTLQKKYILAAFVIIVIFIGGTFYSFYTQHHMPSTPPVIGPLSNNLSCQEMYSQIETDIKAANYCQGDSDCDVLLLGGEYVSFGCYHFINKEVDKEQFYKNMNIYREKCSRAVDDCTPTPVARCENQKCGPFN
jgi:hypothetical protein